MSKLAAVSPTLTPSPPWESIPGDIIGCLSRGPRFSLSAACLLSWVCTMSSRPYGFSYIIMLRPCARITLAKGQSGA